MALLSSPAEQPATLARRPPAGSYGVVEPATGEPTDVPWYLDPREILLTLRLRRRWVALPAAAGLLLALAAFALVPHQFTSQTEILIDPQGLQVVKDDLNPPGQTSDASLLLVDSQMQVLSSDDVLRQVVDRFGLDKDPEFIGRPSLVGSAIGALSAVFGSSGPVHDVKLDALRTLRDRIKSHRMERTFAIVVAVTTTEREKSAELAQGVADLYLGYDRQVRADWARRASDALTARLGELQAGVRDAEDKAQAYRTAQNLVGTRTQLVSEQQLGQIGDQLGAARARAAEQLTRLNQIEAVIGAGGSLDALPQVLQSTTISQLRTQLAQAERILADQSTMLGAHHPTMVAAESDVRGARAQLNAEVKRIASSIRNEYRAAAANVAALSDTLDKGKEEAVSVGDAMVHLRELERQIDARRSVYETFLVRARELQAQQQLGTSASRIISPASPAAQRDGPSAMALAAGGLLLSVGLGVGLALLVEGSSGRIRTRRRLGRKLSLDVLGALPPLAPAAGQTAAELQASGRYDLAVMRLRNHLVRTRPHGGGQMIVVTAADASAGKSRLALTLASLAADDRDKVLLVDADPAGNLQDEFDLPVVPMAARAKDGFKVLPERGVAQRPGLSYISVNPTTARQEFRAVAETLFDRIAGYDAIVVNAGLIGSDLFTERLVGSPEVTHVLLAVSGTRSSFPEVDHALSKIDDCPVLAAVLTDALPSDV